MNAGGHDLGAVGRFDQVVIRIGGIRSLEAAAVAEAEGAARQQGQPPGSQPFAQPPAGLQQGLRQSLVGADRRGDVLQVAVVRFRDEITEIPSHLAGNAHVGAVRSPGEQLHFKALEQQPFAHGRSGLRQARAVSMPRALLRVSWYSAVGFESATTPAPACTFTLQPPDGSG